MRYNRRFWRALSKKTRPEHVSRKLAWQVAQYACFEAELTRLENAFKLGVFHEAYCPRMLNITTATAIDSAVFRIVGYDHRGRVLGIVGT